MDEQLSVYLDHLITRDNLRYKRSEEFMHYDVPPEPQMLRMYDLFTNQPYLKLLRKPDFQRATWAWSPQECVTLLESIINEQVIPSIIMWSSRDNGYVYVLDGGHRVSVVLAWLRDDWGDRLDTDLYRDTKQQEIIKKAAQEVRDSVKIKMGSFREYQEADRLFDNLVDEGKAPKDEMDPKIFARAQFYRRVLKGSVGFHILWVTGNYEKAEQSFLRINRGGKPLSIWETKLIDNRNSSFARAVMSIANIISSQYYWPDKAPAGPHQEELGQKISGILDGVDKLNEALFKPPYETPVRRLQLPLLVPPTSEWRPIYIAELLTVVEGGKGHEAETEKLLKMDQDALPETIIRNGARLLEETLDTLHHLTLPSPKSLALVPALYFYTDAGRYVRSLLYGFLYWLFSGDNEEATLARKRIFSVHRERFEEVLMARKEDVVTGISRKSGSGPEVTVQTARYYQGLLDLLIKHSDQITSPGFQADYSALTDTLTDKRTRTSQSSAGKSRLFTEKQRSSTVLRSLFSNPIRCGICGGILDPSGPIEHDHTKERHKGGLTLVENERLAHPFCNNNRAIIEAIQRGQKQVILPAFVDPDVVVGYKQLSFIDIQDFEPFSSS